MIDHGKTRSAIKPEPIVIDDFSVWKNTDIHEVSETIGENEFNGFEYNVKQYSKNEFILMQKEEQENLQQLLVDTQLALCEVYELM